MTYRAFSRVLWHALFLASAVAGAAPGTTALERGNFLRVPAYQTTATLPLFVSTTGSDGNDCLSAGAGACLTLQGAIDKIPKQVRHTTTIVMGSGTFTAGAYIDGSVFGQSASVTTGASIEVDGTLITATVATGSATGTASSGTAGSGATFGTLTDGTQTWTVNDLRGKLIEITGGTGSGQFRVIDSNTATTVTIIRNWTAPNATSTYAIRDWGTVISGDVAYPQQNSFIAANVQGNSASIAIGALPTNLARVTLRWLKFTGAGAVSALTGSTVEVAECRAATSRTFSAFQSNGSQLFLTRNSFQIPSAAINYLTTQAGNQALLSTNNLYIGDGTGTILLPSGTSYANLSFSGDSFRSVANALRADGLNMAVFNSRFDTISGVCIGNSGRTGVTNQYVNTGRIYINVADFTGCGIAFDAHGNNGLSAFGVISGSGNTTIYKLTNGATIEESSTATITGTTEINVDGTTYTVADLRALSPKSIVNLSTLSHIWEP